MKILCLQLARAGDIYQTWPVIRGLRRVFPEAEIDLVVRSRFASAAVGLTDASRVIEMPTANWLTPVIENSWQIEQLFSKHFEDWVTKNNLQNYDRIINLSFSPVSSYLVDLLQTTETVVSGYTRHADGFFAIPDDASSYFYAQVGIEKSNRIHVSDLFALVAGIELIEEDFRAPETTRVTSQRSGVVVQVGASNRNKTCSTQTWSQCIQSIVEKTNEMVTVVGADQDSELLSAEILAHPNVRNRVGQTSLFELFQIIADAKLFIGCDSVGIHVASLTNTQTLNLSFATVRFWETGPRATNSRVIWFDTPELCSAERVTEEVVCMLESRRSKFPVVLKADRFGMIYDLEGYDDDSDFAWGLTKALYLGEAFPTTQDAHVQLGFQRLGELASVGVEQIHSIEERRGTTIAVSILDQVDHLIGEVARLVPDVSPAVRWFQTEKTRIGPMEPQRILQATSELFAKLRDMSQIYLVSVKMSSNLDAQEYAWKS